MTKREYLRELSDALDKFMPASERDSILQYYSEYFADAGEDSEGEVISELGSPAALARRLAAEGGYNSKPKTWWNKAIRVTVLVLASLLLLNCCGINLISIRIGSSDYKPSATETDAEAGAGVWSESDGSLEPFQSVDVGIDFGVVTLAKGDEYSLSVEVGGSTGDYAIRWENNGGVLEVTSAGKLAGAYRKNGMSLSI